MKSNSSANTSASAGSLGIGPCVSRSSSSSVFGERSGEPARLLPEGPVSSTEPVYDCIAYLIYCPEHDRIAVSNVDKLKCVWLPFVVLPDGATWKKASHEGVAVLIGRQDPEMDADEAEKTAPVYQMSYLNILRIQLSSSRIVMRLTQFVHLQNNPHFRCCEDNMRVNWVPSADIISDKVEKLWGPEVKMLTAMLAATQPQIIDEHTLTGSLYNLNRPDSPEGKALHDRKLSEHQIYVIYNDFVEHCYPSFYMCFESFRTYMNKSKACREENVRLEQLFHGFAASHDDFIDFQDFLVGIVSIDPKTTNNLEARTRFIYRFYDTERKGYIDSNNLTNILKDVYPSFDQATVDQFKEMLTKNLPDKDQITYEQFISLKSDFVSKLIYLCRASKSILEHIAESRRRYVKKKASSYNLLQAKRRKQGSGLKGEKGDKVGTCWQCRTQRYAYANHCVTIDTDGRCIEPKIISTDWLKSGDEDENNRSRYSLECMFSFSSIPNIFMDLIRDFFLKQNANTMGLMSGTEDRGIFLKYVRILCTELRTVLVQEDKLLRINAPCFVIGDIQGNLRDLLQINRLFFQSFPVIPDNLLFLGNYSGDNPTGVECLLYVFSLKLISPNKVFLLRGQNELRKTSEHFLKKECIRKYGNSQGPEVFSIFTEIFSVLPLAALIDESIACISSGPPVTKNLDKLYHLPKELSENDHGIVNEIATRVPEVKQVTKKYGNGGSKVFGSKIGENNLNVNISVVQFRRKSLSRSTSKSIKMKSNKSLSKIKSSISSNLSVKSATLKCRKSLTSTFSGTQIKTKQLATTKSKINQKVTATPSVKFRTLKDNTKMKISFLKPLRLSKGPNSKRVQRQSTQGSGKTTSTDRSNRMVADNFDQNEFEEFLSTNNLSFVIRSNMSGKNCSALNSPTGGNVTSGFRMDYENQLLTVVSNIPSKLTNSAEASVILVDSSTNTIRFIRFDPNN